MTLALKYPELAKQLILLSPAGFEVFNASEKAWLQRFFTTESIRKATEEQIRVNYAYNFFQMPPDVEGMINDRVAIRAAEDFEIYCKVVARGVLGMLNEPVFDRLDQLGMPVLTIFGANDALIPNKILHPMSSTAAVAKSGSGRIRQCKLEFIEKAGHFVQYEKPAEVVELIRGFLSD